MKRTDIRKIFTGRKKALAGCLAAVIVLAGGFNVWQSSQVPEFPNFTDPVVETTITEDDTPLASKPKVTTKFKTEGDYQNDFKYQDNQKKS